MPVPTHGPFCQTLVYPTSCWHCKQRIHILQCTCGSVVLFDSGEPPWPKHVCSRTGAGTSGVGDSGLSGWQAVDVLRSQGVPISFDIMEKIFGDGQQPTYRDTELADDIRRIEPKIDETRNMLAVIRELNKCTRRTSSVDELSSMGRQLLGLANTRYWQITIVQNNTRPNESYTALVLESFAQTLEEGMMVNVSMSAQVSGNFSEWVVSSIDTL